MPKCCTPPRRITLQTLNTDLINQVRLFPSTMTGSWINPSPHFLRAYMTGDYSYIHLIYAATIGAQVRQFRVPLVGSTRT